MVDSSLLNSRKDRRSGFRLNLVRIERLWYRAWEAHVRRFRLYQYPTLAKRSINTLRKSQGLSD